MLRHDSSAVIHGSILALTLGLLASATATAQAPAAAAAKFKGVWEPVNYSEDISLTDVFFVTPETGYVAGAAGTILKTTDSGASWTALLGGDPQSQENAIQQLWFINPTTGWATQVTSSQAHLFRTTDGESWGRIGVIDEHYEDFAFSTESDGVYVDDESIYRTQDSGKSWRKVHECATRAEIGGLMRQIQCQLTKINFASPSVAYALGRTVGGINAAVVLKSQDAGASWSVVTLLENENGWEGGLFFIDESTGYLATKDAKASYRTTDGGATWTGMPATAIPRQIAFADPGVGWALRYNRLSYTTDGGKRWFSRDIAFPAMANAFSLPRRDRAYAVGDHGMIYRYSVVPETAAVAARTVAAPAMPGLDNAVLAQITQLETRLAKIDAAIEGADGHVGSDTGAAGNAEGAAGSNGDTQAAVPWSDAGVQQQLTQLQGTVESIATGVPQMGRKHRNLNMVMFGLDLLADLTGQGDGLKSAFSGLLQAKDLNAAAQALTGMHTQLDAMKTSVDTFKTARK